MSSGLLSKWADYRLIGSLSTQWQDSTSSISTTFLLSGFAYFLKITIENIGKIAVDYDDELSVHTGLGDAILVADEIVADTKEKQQATWLLG